MSILPKTQSASYSLFAAQWAGDHIGSPLLLPAPKIAGLLGSGPLPNHRTEPIPLPTELIYDDPRLASLMPWAFADFRREVLTFLEAVVSLLTGETDRQQFGEAGVRFNGQMTLLYKLLVPIEQQSPIPVAKTRAELDEDMDAMRQHARQRLIDQYEDITRRRAARRVADWPLSRGRERGWGEGQS